MLTSSALDSMDGIRHGFFTREGGHSDGLYASLNCGPGSSDDLDTVMRNRASVAKRMGIAPPNLISVYQIHSPVAVIVENSWERTDAPKADAMVTVEQGIALAISTADCVPVLFADPEARVIGAAHAGWKGAAGGVLEACVAAMEELGADVERIHGTIGPCIHQDSYEVGSEFRDSIIALHDENDRFFILGERDGHFQFDLPGYVSSRLKGIGIGQIDDMAVDTYIDESRFFSFRRTTHRNEPDYGRQLSVIALEAL